MDVPFDLWGQRGEAGLEVVGEPQYAAAIRDVLGPSFRPGGSELMVTARLVPEPWNQDAVAVRVGERPVGYLPRPAAARCAPVLARLVAAGRAPQVAARLRAMSDHRGLTASVWVDLAAPHLIAPVNPPPDGPSRLLPPGAAIPVIIDEKLWPRAGDCWFYVTLHELVEPLPRGSRSVLQVRLDGAVIGRLTPRMSAELLPAVRRLATGRQLTAARARWTTSGPTPEMVVYSARSHELPELWLDSITPDPPPARAAVAVTTAVRGSVYGAGSTGHWQLNDARKPTAGIERSAPADGADGRRRLVPVPRDATSGVYPAAANARVPAGIRVARPPGETVPPPPAGVRFATPPGWPAPPPGWTPPPGWHPNPAWPPAPADWQWWVPYWD